MLDCILENLINSKDKNGMFWIYFIFLNFDKKPTLSIYYIIYNLYLTSTWNKEKP